MGHCEWVTFARVATLPARGEIATALESWEQPAGGGATAARAMHRLNPDTHATPPSPPR